MPRDTEADKLILDEANERFELIQSVDKDNRDNYKADLQFVYSPGKQWPDDVRTTREGWKELCLEFNQLKQFVAQVVNDQLQNRPGIRVHPAAGDASEDVAEIEQGMIRAIEYDSKADDVYKNAFKLAVAGGRGWWRICSEYEDNDGFNQKLVIKPIQDSNTVYADTDYEQPDGSDRNYVFVTARFTKQEFLRKWPNKDPISWDQMPPYWEDGKDSIVVADYYRRVCKKRVIVLMTDGNKGFKDELPPEAEWPEGVTIQMEREVDNYSVEWYTIAGGQQILEKYDWPGTVIPVVCVPGEDMILDGRRIYQGLTRHARDAQSMLNFGMTQQATQLALSPRAPWVMAEGQQEGYENMWRDANQKNWSTLIYKPVTIEGNIAPPPQRTQPAMVSDGWDRWCQNMIAMIKSTIGIYENSLGQKSQETSRVAIVAKEKQGDTATFNYVNNWHMAIALTGKIIVEAIPTFYDTERIVATIGPDDVKKMVPINQSAPNPEAPDDPLQAIKNNDITKGKYAVTVEAGPSYATQKEEKAELISDLAGKWPELKSVAGDLIIKSLNVPDGEALADRAKFLLPPEVRQSMETEGKDKAPPDPQMIAKLQEQQAHLDQAAQTMDEMHKRIQELESGSQAKLQAAQIDAQTKMQIAQMEQETKEREDQLRAAADIRKAEIDAETVLKRVLIESETKENVARIGAQKDLEVAAMPAPEALTAETDQESDAENQAIANS